MNPITFFVLSFVVWVVAKKEATSYWALATTSNPNGSILGPSGNAKAGAATPTPAASAPHVVGAQVGG